MRQSRLPILILLLAGLVGLIVFVGTNYGFFNHESAKERERKEALEALFQGAIAMQERYQDLGWLHLEDLDEACLSSLGKKVYSHPEHLLCNPQLLECLFEGRIKNQENFISVRRGERSYKLRAQKIFTASLGKKNANYGHYRSLTPGNASIEDSSLWNLKVDELPSWSLLIALENSCSDLYLPQRKYGAGIYNLKEDQRNKNDWTWSNIGRDIWIDRFQVRWSKIQEWLENDVHASRFVETSRIYELMQKEDLSLPAHSLSSAAMKRFCSFYGKQVLQSHVLDAASFIPMDEKIKNPPRVFRSPFYWTKKANDAFIYKIWAEKEVLDLLNFDDCRLLPGRECLELYPELKYSPAPASWMGIQEVLGNQFEYVVNPYDPSLNLRASSSYLSMENKLQQLGARTRWDEEKNEVRDADDQNISEPQIGFRCMKLAPSQELKDYKEHMLYLQAEFPDELFPLAIKLIQANRFSSRFDWEKGVRVKKLPPNTLMDIAEFSYLELRQRPDLSFFVDEIKACLVLQTPFREKKAKLKVIDLKGEKKTCKDVLFDEGESFEFEGIKSFVRENYVLHIKRNAGFSDFMFPLLNFEGEFNRPDLQFKKAKKFSSSFTLLPLKGVRFLRFIMGQGPSRYTASPETDKINLCHKLSTFSGEYSCNLCQGSWYEIASLSASLERREKKCGIDVCGEINQPACIRDVQKIDKECRNKGDAVFCQKGLIASCVDGVFICQ